MDTAQKIAAQKNLLSISQAASYLGVSLDSLRRWDKQGFLSPIRTPGQQRRYTKDQLDSFLTNRGTITKSEETIGKNLNPLPKQFKSLYNKGSLFLGQISQLRTHAQKAVGLISEQAADVKQPPVAPLPSKNLQFASIAVTAVTFGLSFLYPIIAQVINPTQPQFQRPAFLQPENVLGITTSKLNLSGNITFGLPSTFKENVVVEDKNLDIGTGELTASNVIYSATSGTGISIAGTQNLSIANTDPGSVQNIFKNIKIDTTTLSAGSNTDTFTIAAGSNISLSSDTSNKKLTIAASVPSGGISGSGTAGQIAFFDATSSITSESSGFGWNATNNLFTITSSSTTGTVQSVSNTSFTTGEILDLTGTFAPTDGSTNEAIDLNITHTPTTSADNFQSINLTTTDATALANTVYNLQGTLTLTGNIGKTGYGIYSTVTSNSTTADTTYGGYFTTTQSGAVTSGTVNSYGLYSTATDTGVNTTTATVNLYGGYFTPSTTSSSTATVNVYGDYIANTAKVTGAGTVNSYGLYIANGTMDTTGTSTQYGLYVAAPSGADNNFAVQTYGNVGLFKAAPASADVKTPMTTLDIFSTADLQNGSGTEANYHLILRNDTSSTGDRIGIGFEDGSSTGNVGGFVAFVRQGAASAGDLQFGTKATGGTISEKMRIDGAGNVLIGTAALATTATDGFIYIPTSAGAPTGTPTTYTGRSAFEFDTTNNKLCAYNQTGTAAWKCTAALSDIAEWAPAAGAQSGDIVIITDQPNTVNDPTAPFMLAKSTSAFQPGIVGIVSEYAEQANSANGYKLSDDYHAVSIAGRVPIKVNTEGGPVKKGDYLTSSSTPGVAMKATKPGQVVGKALEDFPASQGETLQGTLQGKIMVFVNVGFADPNGLLASLEIAPDGSVVYSGQAPDFPEAPYNPSGTATTNPDEKNSSYDLAQDPLYQNLSSRVDSLATRLSTLEDEVASISAKQVVEQSTSQPIPGEFIQEEISSKHIITDLLDTKDATVSGQLNVLGRSTLSDVGITGDLNIGLITVHGLDAEINTLAGDLKLQRSQLGGIDILAGKIVIDKDGNMVSQGTIITKALETEKLTITNPEAATSSAVLNTSIGSGKILAGQTKIQIKTTAVTNKSKIFITAQNALNSPIFVSDKISGEEFTVRIAQQEVADVKFDWWIVETR